MTTEEARLLAAVRSAERAAAQWGKDNEDAQYVSEALAQVSEFLTSEADRVAQAKAEALGVVKRACDVECKSPGTHTGCSSHEPYRALRASTIRPAAPSEGSES